MATAEAREASGIAGVRQPRFSLQRFWNCTKEVLVASSSIKKTRKGADKHGSRFLRAGASRFFRIPRGMRGSVSWGEL
jgi:hypothetical protein